MKIPKSPKLIQGRLFCVHADGGEFWDETLVVEAQSRWKRCRIHTANGVHIAPSVTPQDALNMLRIGSWKTIGPREFQRIMKGAKK